MYYFTGDNSFLPPINCLVKVLELLLPIIPGGAIGTWANPICIWLLGITLQQQAQANIPAKQLVLFWSGDWHPSHLSKVPLPLWERVGIAGGTKAILSVHGGKMPLRYWLACAAKSRIQSIQMGKLNTNRPPLGSTTRTTGNNGCGLIRVQLY